MENKLTRNSSEGVITFGGNDFYDIDEYKSIYKMVCNHLHGNENDCPFCSKLDNLFYDEKCDVDNDVILFDITKTSSAPKKYCEIRRIEEGYHDTTLAFVFKNIMRCIHPLLTKDSFSIEKGVPPLKYGCGKLKVERWDVESPSSNWWPALDIACIPWKGIYE